MNIILKNITGEENNEWLLWEIKKDTGLTVGRVIDAKYNEKTGTCYFSIGNTNCIAWLGQTCEEYKKLLPEKK